MSPLFSVIIPCYNHGSFLEGAIASIPADSSIPCEIIIVDDGSDDTQTISTLAALEGRLPNLTILRQTNGGPGKARNTGIRAATGQFIVPLDADDRLRAEYLHQAAAVFSAELSVAVVYCNFQRFGGESSSESHPPFTLQGLLLRNIIGACAIYRKDAWAAVGGYDEALRRGLSWEDWDLWLNMAYHGYHFRHLNLIGYDYYFHDQSRERTLLRSKQKVNSIISRFEEKYPDFYAPSELHRYFLNNLKRRPLVTFSKILLAAYLPRTYQRLVQEGKFQKYLF